MVGTTKKMRVCVLGNTNLKHMTLMSLYTSFFEKKGIPYDVIYFDQYGIKEKCGADKLYRFEKKSTDDSTILAKISRQIEKTKYYQFAKQILGNNHYDFIVVWREETAVQFSGLLSKKYQGKYSVNIRDIDICDGKRKEQNLKRLEKCVKNSCFNTVSSDGFIKFLPKADYLFVHSANESLLNDLSGTSKKGESGPIVISSVGSFRNDEYCFKLADSLANDKRFELRFIGQGAERIEQYANSKNYNNVVCHGSFKPSETVSFFDDVDIVNCAYGADRIAEKAKMPIRFYYAVFLKKPILTTIGTWIKKNASELQLGIEIPEDFTEADNIGDLIYNQYMRLNKNVYEKKIDEYIEEIMLSHDKLQELVMKCLNGC